MLTYGIGCLAGGAQNRIVESKIYFSSYCQQHEKMRSKMQCNRQKNNNKGMINMTINYKT